MFTFNDFIHVLRHALLHRYFFIYAHEMSVVINRKILTRISNDQKPRVNIVEVCRIYCIYLEPSIERASVPRHVIHVCKLLCFQLSLCYSLNTVLSGNDNLMASWSRMRNQLVIQISMLIFTVKYTN